MMTCMLSFLEDLVPDRENDMLVLNWTAKRGIDTHSVYLFRNSRQYISVSIDWEQEGSLILKAKLGTCIYLLKTLWQL